jgi:hypothetical protein
MGGQMKKFLKDYIAFMFVEMKRLPLFLLGATVVQFVIYCALTLMNVYLR